ncbi:hypothetical protein JRO89_XS06G0138600 [Xanthoceras sorbifolium]|uniref:WAT1-related protein n=1 Tax=Xanthoceras sorbifolium TaxID=99658 RepID=A0ABQ8HY59_9ROSI|nr:hypothetical protein JRO89_XS06G0138600 [Xanthoceras sorbifolium]
MKFIISSSVTVNQNMCNEGLYLASSTMGSAMSNLVPAITFFMAAIVGLEKINIGSLRSTAKISGTVLYVMVIMMITPGCWVAYYSLEALLAGHFGWFCSLTGAIGVIIGLYIVLWGKAGETLSIKEETDPNIRIKNILIDESSDQKKTRSNETDLEEPLLFDHKSTN